MITPSNKLTTVIKRIKRSTKPTTGYNNSLRLSHNVILLAAMLGMASVRGMQSRTTSRSNSRSTSLSNLDSASERSLDQPMNDFQNYVRTLTDSSIDNMDEIISMQESLTEKVISLEETQAKLTYLRTLTKPRLDKERKEYWAQIETEKDENYKNREGGYRYGKWLREGQEMYRAGINSGRKPLLFPEIFKKEEDSLDRNLKAHRPEGLGKIGGFFSGKNWTTVEQERLGFAEKCITCGDAGTVTPKTKAECTIGATPYTFGWFSHIGHLCSMPCPDCVRREGTKVFLTKRIYNEKARGGYYEEGTECMLKAIDNKSFNRTPRATIMIDGRSFTVDSTKLENELVHNERLRSQLRSTVRRGSLSRQNSNRYSRRSTSSPLRTFEM